MSKKPEKKASKRPGPSAGPAPDVPVKSHRILIVDDHPIVRTGLADWINRKPDLEVCAEAEDYRQALTAVEQSNPDLAVVDLTLKDIGGLELIKQLRTTHPDLSILVLSMHDEALYAERALRAGAKGYIMKQAGSDKILEAIRAVLDGRVYVSEALNSQLLGKLVGGSTEPGGSPLDALSNRELEVFELIGRGVGTRQIADRLCVSVSTVETHRKHIKEKLAIKSAPELVQHASRWIMQQQND